MTTFVLVCQIDIEHSLCPQLAVNSILFLILFLPSYVIHKVWSVLHIVLYSDPWSIHVAVELYIFF